MFRPKRYFLPTKAVFRLVEPDDPSDVLKALKDMGLIDRFKIGVQYIQIESRQEDSVELANIMASQSLPERPYFGGVRRKKDN